MNTKSTTEKRSRATRVDASGSRSVLTSPFTWLLALVLVAGAIAVGLASASRSDGGGTPVNQTAFAELSGDSLPALTNPDPAVGMAVPTVSALTLEGDRISLQADGTARLYGFFAHWCPHCRAELPRTAQWLESNTLPADVEVVAVSTAVDETAANYPPSNWFEQEDWPATVLLDSADNTIAGGFGVTGFPYWVAVDADGNVVARMSGELDDSQLAALITSLSDA